MLFAPNGVLRRAVMRSLRICARLGALPVLLATTHTANAAVPAPTGAHPRLWLDSATVAGLKGAGAKSAVAKGATRCAAARNDPSSYATGGWQGFEFVLTLSGCLVSYEASGNADDLTIALKYFNVLLDDYQTVGDGAGGDNVITHDTGYAMRTFAPYSAIAYDWLHDAPGMTEALRAHARERFNAWVSYYASNGYLRHMPGSNYEAGFEFASTLIAIAEGGEAGADGDSHWSLVRDTIWGTDLQPAFADGTLTGGDWPEGWQYGPLSVLEHALGARAMQDNGAGIPVTTQWADSLVQRFASGLTPSTFQAFAGGDTEATTANIAPDNGPLVAVIAGPADETARAWARKLDSDLALSNDNSLFDALAGARTGASAAPANAPTGYLAQGTGNFYVRGAWTKDTAWSVFQCSRRLVDDHQHNDAGNFVLTRGADDLVVDPSPYGSLSTLTGNAPAVDSAVLPDGYSPSQAGWGQTTKLVWSKQSSSGVAVARCDYADQFRTEETASDVQHALRDYVMVPTQGGDGTVVLVDRVVTGDAGRALHLRVRTPATLSLGGDTATATVGSSALSIQKVFASSGVGSVRDMPTGSDCSSSPRGQCDISRLSSGQEYRLDVAGPEAVAIHVVDGHAAGASAPTSTLLTGTGYRGALVTRASGSIAVVATDKADGSIASSLTYGVPAGSGAVHVVVDAPAGTTGRSDVTGVLDGTNCKMTVTPHAGTSGGFDGHGLVIRVSSSCAVTDDTAVQAPVTPVSPSGAGGTSAGVAGVGGTASIAGVGGTASITGAGAAASIAGAGGVASVAGAGGATGTATTANAGGSAMAIDADGGVGATTNGQGGTTATVPQSGMTLGSASSMAGNPIQAASGANCSMRHGPARGTSTPLAMAACIGALGLVRRRRNVRTNSSPAT